jgi:uncharacterized protein YjcR
MPILKSHTAHTSSRLPLLLPTDGRNAVQATAASAAASDQTSPENTKTRVFNTALALTGLEYGVAKAESQHRLILQHTSEEIEEAELDEAWDLNAAQDAPT